MVVVDVGDEFQCWWWVFGEVGWVEVVVGDDRWIMAPMGGIT